MRPRKLAAAVFALAACAAAAAAAPQQLEAPKLTPAASTERQTQLVREGVALHEQRKYDEAIAKYEEVLRENPDHVGALYEQALSYHAKKDYRRSLEVGHRGARYKSPLLPQFYVLIANALDDQGDAEQAVKVYKSGIKLYPEESLLHFNLAVTYNRLKKPDEARKSLKRALAHNPAHPTSNLLLAALYNAGNLRVPALLAAARFLVLEPASPRSAGALRAVQQLMGRGVEQKSPTETSIFVELNPNKEEGDFTGLDMMLSLGRAGRNLEKNKGKTEIELLVAEFGLLFSMMGEGEDKKNAKKFVGAYYVPYFAELKRRDFVEPFVYHIFQTSDLPGVKEWLRDHSYRVQAFLTWSKNYQWAKQFED